MFDTSLVRSRAIAVPRFGLLAVSLAAHSAAIVGAIALTLASTQLPSNAPNQMEIYRPVVLPTVPPAYGHPPRPNVPRPAPGPVRAQLPPGTAPNAIPDQTPVVPPVSAGPAEGPIEGPDGGPIGDPLGDPNSVNPLDTTPQPAVAPPPVPYTPGGDVTAARVLRRVEPRYPTVMLTNRVPAVVTVHCVIDKNGSIRDPQIVQSSFPPFNEAVLEAVRQWTFTPGTRRGQPVDTYFELTVRFVAR